MSAPVGRAVALPPAALPGGGHGDPSGGRAVGLLESKFAEYPQRRAREIADRAARACATRQTARCAELRIPAASGLEVIFIGAWRTAGGGIGRPGRRKWDWTAPWLLKGIGLAIMLPSSASSAWSRGTSRSACFSCSAGLRRPSPGGFCGGRPHAPCGGKRILPECALRIPARADRLSVASVRRAAVGASVGAPAPRPDAQQNDGDARDKTEEQECDLLPPRPAADLGLKFSLPSRVTFNCTGSDRNTLCYHREKEENDADNEPDE